MALPKPRSQIIQPTETVALRALFRDGYGQPADLDAFPQITIVQPTGNVALGPTSAGVYKADTGLYGYDLTIQYQPDVGVWTDLWQGTLSGIPINGSFNFVVYTTDMPAINSDGYVHLGDDPGFNYSQEATININYLLKALRARLKSSGKVRSKDQYGNQVFIDCDIYSTDQLVTFLADSLTLFNEIPHFTNFTFDDTDIIRQFLNIIVQGATLLALSSQALIERGREFQITDNGVNFNPPTVSELLNTQFSTELTNHMEKLKMIKASMKPSAIGLGGIRALGASPQWMKLRHLRSRRLY